jgi:hypothetical protein
MPSARVAVETIEDCWQEKKTDSKVGHSGGTAPLFSTVLCWPFLQILQVEELFCVTPDKKYKSSYFIRC